MSNAIQPTTQHHVGELTEALVNEFGDRVDRTQIDALMQDSVARLAGQAEVEDFLPVLAHRFTRERLLSLARTRAGSLDIVFVSLSGGGRGQLAAALTTLLASENVTVHSAGTAAGGAIDQAV